MLTVNAERHLRNFVGVIEALGQCPTENRAIVRAGHLTLFKLCLMYNNYRSFTPYSSDSFVLAANHFINEMRARGDIHEGYFRLEAIGASYISLKLSITPIMGKKWVFGIIPDKMLYAEPAALYYDRIVNEDINEEGEP
jgi:hypothetical protein